MITQLVIYKLAAHNAPHFHDRFRDHTLNAMKRLGLQVLAVWTAQPVNPVEGAPVPVEVVYLLRWDTEDALRAGWALMNTDPEYDIIRKATEAQYGKFVEGVENRMMTAVDYFTGPLAAVGPGHVVQTD